MTTIAAFLMALGLPLVLRVLAGLGFSMVAFTGVNEGVGALIGVAQANWSALPVMVLQLASLSGIPQMLGMIAAALVTRLSLWVAVASTRFIVR